MQPRRRRFAVAGLVMLLCGCGGQGKPSAPPPYVSKRQKPAPGADMAELADTLKQAGVDTATLENVYEFAGKNFYGLRVNGAQAVDLWRKLRGLVEKTGRWPVIAGAPISVDGHADFMKSSEIDKPENVLARAEKAPAEKWFKEAFAEWKQLSAADPSASHETGQWPDKVERLEKYTIPTEILSGTPLPEVTIVLVPTPNSWEVPAWLMFGGWNECPIPEVQVALLKFWHEKYGAEIVGISHDVMELEVTRPPKERQAALALAREQFVFCQDIVTQGAGSVDALAATLLNGKVWYFWWD